MAYAAGRLARIPKASQNQCPAPRSCVDSDTRGVDFTGAATRAVTPDGRFWQENAPGWEPADPLGEATGEFGPYWHPPSRPLRVADRLSPSRVWTLLALGVDLAGATRSYPLDLAGRLKY
jgi:hypothetical protein